MLFLCVKAGKKEIIVEYNHLEVIFMLRAKSNTGEFVTLATLTKREIHKYRKKYKFSCPACLSPVMVKAGKQMIPHFAHYSKVKCPLEKGGESLYHAQGKLLLYQWLMSQKLHVELEPYVQEIQQQPDILLEIQSKKIAIEFQCARIDIKQIQKRHNGYIKAGITPIWILGANRLKRQGNNQIIADQFTKQFIHRFSSSLPHELFYFCPKTLQFLSFKNILFTRKNRAIGKFYLEKLDQLNFLDLFQKSSYSKKTILKSWQIEKRNFRTFYRSQSYGRERSWLQWLYLKQTHHEYLPSEIYLPVSSQYQMKTSPWDWQSRLCLDIIDPLQVGSTFNVNRCNHLLKNHMHPQGYFPLIQYTHHHPILQYFHHLEKLSIIKKKSAHHFIKVGQFSFYNHIEEAIKGDDQTINKLMIKK